MRGRAMRIRPIHDEDAYREALRRIEELMDAKPDRPKATSSMS
jgi:antitoxin component HigA of HigAB toxin-antitoxin module